MNIIEPILFQAKLNPEALALCAPGTQPGSVTYGQLERLMNNIARTALRAGLRRGNVVAVHLSDPILNMAASLALTRVGIITASPRGTSLPREAGVSAILTDSAARFENVGRVIATDASWTIGDGKPLSDATAYHSRGDDLCRIVFTSGTTGKPKPVALSHRLVAERVARRYPIFGSQLPHLDRMYFGVGLGTALGFEFLIYLLWRGGAAFFPGQSAESAAQAFELYGVQSMLTSAHALASTLSFYEANSAFPCRLEHIICGGSLLPRELAERVQARMCSTLFCAYGATEVSVVAAASAETIRDVPGAVGYVTPGVSVEIVDESERPLAGRAEGLVRIRSPYNAEGYMGDQPETDKAFRNGCFYPADIGYLRDDGMLVITGRESAVLNIGGDKVAPEVVEAALVSFAGVAEAAAFTMPNQFGIPELCAAIVSTSPLDEDALRAHCSEKLERAFVPLRFIRIEKIPRNEMGKIERPHLAELTKQASF
ncbi:MAG: class I adenylate-forming enzyme family protein [Xanthobacteraceae bacterium]